MSLEAFLNKFNSADGKYMYSIDPLKTFDVTIDFGGFGDGMSGSASNSPLREGITNVLNNATGGIFGKAMNSSKSETPKSGQPNIPALATASLFSDGVGSKMNLKYFVQEATLPNISIPSDTQADTVVGSVVTHKMAVETDSKEFSMKILNTRVSLVDRIFYPWMREISYPYWSYAQYPYTTATITIDFSEHNDIRYVFLGARPTKVESLNPTNALDTNMSRSVTFAFDFMYIDSVGKNIESIKDTIMNTGKSIINKAASMIAL